MESGGDSRAFRSMLFSLFRRKVLTPTVKMSSPSKSREMDLMKLMMSDYKVKMINDGMQEFYIDFNGPKERLLSRMRLEVHHFQFHRGWGLFEQHLCNNQRHLYMVVLGMLLWLLSSPFLLGLAGTLSSFFIEFHHQLQLLHNNQQLWCPPSSHRK